jgi:DNA topoisomerase-1
VSHNGVNATLPADKSPETITLHEALALLEARANRSGTRTRRQTGQDSTTRRSPEATTAKPKEKTAATPRRRTAAAPRPGRRSK